jgi:hypothetical protein
MDYLKGARRPLAVLPNGHIDPAKVDLGGVAGVTPAEQKRAEDLLRATLLSLPHWSDVNVAKREGYASLEDGGILGRQYVHYVNVAYANDGRQLDPKHPESLVYKVEPGNRLVLAAAMYELEPNVTLKNLPQLGGKLTQWHVHNSICFFPNTFKGKPRNADGSCPDGTELPKTSPVMIHVWSLPNVCGPFATLMDAEGGEMQVGELMMCDRVHGK